MNENNRKFRFKFVSQNMTSNPRRFGSPSRHPMLGYARDYPPMPPPLPPFESIMKGSPPWEPMLNHLKNNPNFFNPSIETPMQTSNPFETSKVFAFDSQNNSKQPFKRNWETVYETRKWDPQRGWHYAKPEHICPQKKCCVESSEIIDHMNACTDSLRNDLQVFRQNIEKTNQEAIEAIKESNDELKTAVIEAIDKSKADLKNYFSEELKKCLKNE